MTISGNDRDVLRELAERTAAIAALPVHRKTAEEWRRLNGRRRGRPLVWINEIPWHEMNVNDELTLRCAGSLAREAECQDADEPLPVGAPSRGYGCRACLLLLARHP